MSTTYVTISEDTIQNVVATDILVIVEDGINTIVGTGAVVPTISLTTSTKMVNFTKTIASLVSPDMIPDIVLSTVVVAKTPIAVPSISLSVPSVPTISVSTSVTGP
jgi:hypothetical protein